MKGFALLYSMGILTTSYQLKAKSCIMSFMKKHLKKMIDPHNWLAFLRRQPIHMQHIYSAIIAGAITSIIAAVILYVDYGFWHERYLSDEITVNIASSTEAQPESPSEMFSRFVGDARTQLDAINSSGKDMLKGKEVYTNTATDTNDSIEK